MSAWDPWWVHGDYGETYHGAPQHEDEDNADLKPDRHEMTEPQRRADTLIRLAVMHAASSTRHVLYANILLDEGKVDLAETILMRGKTEQALADEAIRQAKEIIGTFA